MAQSRGKQFEAILRKAFEDVPGVSIDRIPDQTMGFKGASNICDFVVYKKPYEYYIECKTIHGNTFPFSNITDNQFSGMLQKTKIPGVYAGVMCWWVDKDVTRFLPILDILQMRENFQMKSVRYDQEVGIWIPGKKKRVFFNYDMESFFTLIESEPGRYR